MIMQTLYNMTGGGSPQCQIVLDHERESYKEDDEVRGVVIL
jgi:hypothetical protein